MLSGLGQRVVTALVLAPLFVWAVVAMPTTYFSYLLLVFVAVGAWEFANLIKLQSIFLQLLYTVGIVAVALVAKSFEISLSLVLYISIAWWMLNLYWVLSYPAKTSLWFKPLIVRLISGVLLFLPMWLALSACAVVFTANADYLGCRLWRLPYRQGHRQTQTCTQDQPGKIC